MVEAAPPLAPPIPGRWETRIEPFLARYALALVLCLIAIAGARIISTYNVFSTTGDEPAHVACGLEYLTRHVYLYETQHPPLTRAMIALLPYLSGTRPQGKPQFQSEGWAIITYQNHPERTVFLMRLGNLPFFILGCLVVFFWSRRYFGAAAAVIATAFFTMIPTVLAHAGLATTDMGLAACLGAAFLAMLVWLEAPTTTRGAVFGFCTALALLSKFTSLGFLPAAAGIAFLFYLAAERPGMEKLAQLARERAPSFGIAVAVCLFTVWAAFFFSVGKVPVWNVTLPAWEYFDGIRVALLHNKLGHPAYLLGEARMFGWWYYFPVALAVKTPLALLVLLAIRSLGLLEESAAIALPAAGGVFAWRAAARNERPREHRSSPRAAGLPGLLDHRRARTCGSRAPSDRVRSGQAWPPASWCSGWPRPARCITPITFLTSTN